MQFGKWAGLALIVAAAAAACSGNGSSPAPLPPCPPVAIPLFAMIDPSPGATAVPDNLGQIVFEGFALGPVTLTGGTQTIALTLQPAPTPTPTPASGVPNFVAPLSAPLLSSTTYTASYSYSTFGTNCTSQPETFTAGSFTTE